MDVDEKKAYHQKYNKSYYLKHKLAKQQETGIYFRKIGSSLSSKKTSIEKQLKANEEKAAKFREFLKSQAI